MPVPSFLCQIDRNVPRTPRPVGGVEGHNIKRDYLAGKPRRACPVLTGWAGSFNGFIIPVIIKPR